jgi:DNA-binding XRE family transcriptional regulator
MTTKGPRYGLEELERDFGPLTFAELLTSHRRGEELSQVEMAKVLGISRQNLCDYEKGRKIPSPKKAAEMADTLGFGATTFVQLALQDLLRRDGLNFEVDVNKSTKKRKRA